MIDLSLFGNCTTSPVKLYLDSSKHCEDLLGVQLTLAVGNPEFALHEVKKISPPQEILGINYGKFRCLRKINSEEFGEAQNTLLKLAHAEDSDENHDIINFFAPAFFQQRGASTLSQTAQQLLKLDDNRSLSLIEPMVESTTNVNLKPPATFLPKDSMFDKSLNDLQISDILTIFPPSEAKLLALCIGRGLCGPDGTVTCINNTKINHAFRTFPLIFGAPGLGKSSLFTFLFEAIEKTGYKVSHFNSIDEKFGLGEIFDSNFAYSDDLLTSSLQKLLQAPLFKQAITGSKIRAHIKYAEDIEVKAKSVFIANINNFDSSVLYQLDGGTLDRLAIISTYSEKEIRNHPDVSGLSLDSPNLKVREHITWLANKLQVSTDALMLKFAKLCADLFYQECKNNTLEATIKELKRHLRIQLHLSINESIAQLLQLSYLLNHDKVPQLSGEALASTFHNLNYLVNANEMNWARNLLKEDYVKRGRPSAHIFTAIKMLDNLSVNASAKKDRPQMPMIRDTNKVIKHYWEDLRLNSGFNVPAYIAGIKHDWNTSKLNQQDLIDYINEFKKDERFALIKNCQFDSTFLELDGYDQESHIRELNK